LSRKSKEKVIKAKKEFKGTDNWITEDFTRMNAARVKHLNELRLNRKFKNVWTIDGKIKAKEKDIVVMIR